MKIFLNSQEVKIGDKIMLNSIICKLTQEIIDDNPNLFTILDEEIKVPEYVECIRKPYDWIDTEIGDIYKTDTIGYAKGRYRILINGGGQTCEGVEDHFKPSTKEAYDNYQLILETKKLFPIGTKFIPAHTPTSKEHCIVTTNNFKMGGNRIIALAINNEQYVSPEDYPDHGNTSYNRNVYQDGKWAARYLFTTEDGVEIYESDSCFTVGKDFKNYGSVVCLISNSDKYYYFSTKEAAEKFVKSKQTKSLQDYENIINQIKDLIQ